MIHAQLQHLLREATGKPRLNPYSMIEVLRSRSSALGRHPGFVGPQHLEWKGGRRSGFCSDMAQTVVKICEACTPYERLCGSAMEQSTASNSSVTPRNLLAVVPFLQAGPTPSLNPTRVRVSVMIACVIRFLLHPCVT